MMTHAKHGVAGRLAAAGLTVGLAAIAVSASAQTSGQSANSVPDAQVESSVLRALAGTQDLSTQNIQTQTVYGTVTLSGNVHDEAMRTKAENLVARVQGVKKVVDQLQLGDTPPPTSVADQQPDSNNESVPQGQAQQGPHGQPGEVLLADGTYGPPPTGNQPGQPQPAYPAGSEQNPGSAQNGGYNGPPPNGQPGYDQQGPPPGRQPMYANGNPNAYAPPPGVAPGQRPGMPVVVPAGAPLQVRVNRGMDSQHTPPGTPFDGIVMNDIVANGAVAIPRGATVHGVVVDSKKAGTFKGQGELTLQITSLQLGGQVYPLTSDIWSHFGHDKTAGTVNRTVGTSAFGAIIGAIAGGGEGAAIGAAAGAGAGLATSAGGPRGEIVVPPESILSFAVAQPLPVHTVGQQEMARLSYAAGPATPPPGRPMRRYYSPYYGYYYGPAY